MESDADALLCAQDPASAHTKTQELYEHVQPVGGDK